MAQRKAIALCIVTLSKAALFLIAYVATLGLLPELFEVGYRRLKIGIDCMQRNIK